MKHPLAPERISAAEAASQIFDGATIATSGFGLTGLAQTLIKAIVTRHRLEKSPKELTVIHAAGQSEGTGVDTLAAENGILKRIIGGHWGVTPNVREAAGNENFEQHNWPQGVIACSYRAAAAGEKGLRTPIGLDTYIDPRQLGGCMNESARKAGTLIRMEKDYDGEDCLHYAPLRPDFALVRGWKADRVGNISICWEPLNVSIEHIAVAARNNGGKVFCQVREIEDRIFSSEEVHLPGFLVDAIIVAEDCETEHRHAPSFAFEPSLVQPCMPVNEILQDLDPVRKWIGRRAAMEVRDGDLLNLGIGIPGDAVTPALKAMGKLDRIISTLESGIIGGHGAGAKDFGVAFSPDARIPETLMFDIYHGGNLDIAMMGLAETDASGNVNVSQFAGRNVGCGGFIDITQSARRIVFCATFSGKGFQGVFENGTLRIQAEGSQGKFLPKVQQISFSSIRSRELRQEVLLVTERAVFQLAAHGWELVEIAPGIDLERDVLSRMGFRPPVSPSLRMMDAAIFQK